MRELLSHDGCLTPFLGDFLLIPMLTEKKSRTAIIILVASSLLCDCFEERQRENPVISLIHCHPGSQYTGQFSLCVFSSLDVVYLKIDLPEKTPILMWGPIGTNTRCGPSFPLAGCQVLPSASPLLWSSGECGWGWAGPGNIHNYFSASHNLWQASVLVCCMLEGTLAPLCVTRAPLTTHFVRIH